ncbi:MAG: D-alanyl-D-alanine carboxypeptidase family protein [Betaproteobacteria bacterium]|jgi:D-alanyl-D-alanine carboxypeptidase (penicillin-binding protein 5/6)
MSRLLALWLLGLAACLPALAQVAPPTMTARSWLLLDVTSGHIIASHEPDRKADPASLTKLMTAYIAFNAIKEKRLALDARPMVSQRAFKAIGSRMFVEPANPATVEELLRGMIIQSGNDASIVLAEALAGGEEPFSQLMNKEAVRLGLRNTQFRNATGLPSPEHHSTARDLALLASRLINDHPEYYKLYAEREFTYNKIRQPNRNRLLFVDPSVDGVKTGFTEAAGYCLIASARREQPGAGFSRRLVAVVMGAGSDAARITESQRLLNYGFQNFDTVRAYSKGQTLGKYPVWKGKGELVEGGVESDIFITVARGQAEKVRGEVERVEPLVAPIREGQRIGTLRVKLGEQVLAERAVLAAATVDEAGWFGRMWDGLRLKFSK